MKTTLTIEQSAKLIELGVPKERASKQVMRQATDSHGRPLQDAELKKWSKCQPFEKQEAMQNVGFTKYEFKDIFTISDLLSMLPPSFEEGDYICELSILWDEMDSTWKVHYSPWITEWKYAEYELIDALYKTFIKLIEENYVKPQEL